MQRSPRHAVVLDEDARASVSTRYRRQEGGRTEGESEAEASRRDQSGARTGIDQLADLRPERGERPGAADAPERGACQALVTVRHVRHRSRRQPSSLHGSDAREMLASSPSDRLRASSRRCATIVKTFDIESGTDRLRDPAAWASWAAERGPTPARPQRTSASGAVFARRCVPYCSPTTTAARSRRRPSTHSTSRRTAPGRRALHLRRPDPAPDRDGRGRCHGRIVSAVAAALVDGTWSRLKAARPTTATGASTTRPADAPASGARRASAAPVRSRRAGGTAPVTGEHRVVERPAHDADAPSAERHSDAAFSDP